MNAQFEYSETEWEVTMSQFEEYLARRRREEQIAALTGQPGAEGTFLDINESVARRRREAAAAPRVGPLTGRAHQEAVARVAARKRGAELRVLPLGNRFVQWAKASGIQPTVVHEYLKNRAVFGTRTVRLKGWRLHSKDVGAQHGWRIPSASLVVLESGEIRWVGDASPIISQAEVERYIVDYIVKSRSTVPWPG